MKTIIMTLAGLIAGLLVGVFVGSHNVYMAADVRPDGTESMWYPHVSNVREELDFEREYANALFEGLHRFYSNDDNDAWFDLFVPTAEYQKIDSLNGGDWEDFYFYETPKLEY